MFRAVIWKSGSPRTEHSFIEHLLYYILSTVLGSVNTVKNKTVQKSLLSQGLYSTGEQKKQNK